MSTEIALCFNHPAKLASSSCSRCGTYACSECLARRQRTEPLCVACDDKLAAASLPGIRNAGRLLQATLVLGAGVALLSALVVIAGDANPDASLGALGLAFMFKSLWYVTFVVWFRRANRALAERKVALVFGHHAWLWDFVPVASLFRPYQVLRDIYEWVTAGAVLELGVWWAFTLAAGFAAQGAWPLNSLRTMLALCLMAAADVVLLFIVRRFVRMLASPIIFEDVQPVGPVSTALFDDFR
jgi:hypothetical protein